MPSSPKGPCSNGKTTSTWPSSCGGCPASSTVRTVSLVDSGSTTWAALDSTSGVRPAVELETRRVVRRQHPLTVARDADRHDVVLAPVDGTQHAGGGGARDGVLGGAASEDDGHAGAAARLGGLGLVRGHQSEL